jgi:hypothetical protein
MMTLTEFTQLLEIHGADPANWPPEQRPNMLSLVRDNNEASSILSEFQRLDGLLVAMEAPQFADLGARIANQELPQRQAGLMDRLLNWLLPEKAGSNLWRPALAACLPLVVGVIVGNYSNFAMDQSSQATQYWEDELAMISLADYSANQVEL